MSYVHKENKSRCYLGRITSSSGVHLTSGDHLHRVAGAPSCWKSGGVCWVSSPGRNHLQLPTGGWVAVCHQLLPPPISCLSHITFTTSYAFIRRCGCADLKVSHISYSLDKKGSSAPIPLPKVHAPLGLPFLALQCRRAGPGFFPILLAPLKKLMPQCPLACDWKSVAQLLVRSRIKTGC